MKYLKVLIVLALLIPPSLSAAGGYGRHGSYHSNIHHRPQYRGLHGGGYRGYRSHGFGYNRMYNYDRCIAAQTLIMGGSIIYNIVADQQRVNVYNQQQYNQQQQNNIIQQQQYQINQLQQQINKK